MKARTYRCSACGSEYPPDELVWRCTCGSHLDVDQSEGLSREDIDLGEPSLWRYRAAFESPDSRPAIYFGEGLTPLAPASWAGLDANFKLDYLFPSGSFKDRGTAVMMNRLREPGVQSVVEDSSGNGGASIAAYAAAGGIQCDVYVPGHTSEGKVVQTRTYGSRVVKVQGTREETATAAQDEAAASGKFYASHNWHPLFIEGVKTVAYEIWEQLGYRAPDNVIAPAGFGSNVLGLYRGFSELLARGQVDRIPRIFAAQAANCAGIYSAWIGSGFVEPSPTVAEGIATARPVRLQEILRALTETQGQAVAVTEEAIAEALRDLGRDLGLYVEPTAAVSAAALRQLAHNGEISRGDITVALLTGNGLKATDGIARLNLQASDASPRGEQGECRAEPAASRPGATSTDKLGRA
jgi:threonine synthase